MMGIKLKNLKKELDDQIYLHIWEPERYRLDPELRSQIEAYKKVSPLTNRRIE